MMMPPLVTVLSVNTFRSARLSLAYLVERYSECLWKLVSSFEAFSTSASDHCNGPPLLTVIPTSRLMLPSSGRAPKVSSVAMTRPTYSVASNSEVSHYLGIMGKLSAAQTCACPFPLRPIRRQFLN
jgi:hypothetical protein